MTPGDVVLLLGGGFLAGTVNSVAGGGTLLSFPALLATGLSPVVANVTNTVAVWPGYVSGAAAFRGQLTGERRLLVRLSVAAILGAVIGTVLLLTAPAKVFHQLVPYLVLGATALLALQPGISKSLAHRRPEGTSPRSTLALTAATFVASIYGAYFGGGLGIIVFAVLALGLDRELAQLNGLKTMLALVINTVALIGFAIFGPVDWAAAALIAPASFLGGIVGARIGRRLDPRTLRIAVVLLGCGVGVRLLTS
jgi:uncharacterized membrane protein YfcA